MIFSEYASFHCFYVKNKADHECVTKRHMRFCKCIAIEYYIVVNSTKACVVVTFIALWFSFVLEQRNVLILIRQRRVSSLRHLSATAAGGGPFRSVSKRVTHFVVLQG